MTSRTIETAISAQSVRDQVAAYLYAIGVVNDNDEIEDLQIGGIPSLRSSLGLPPGKNEHLTTIPLKITIKTEKEAQVLDPTK